MRNFFAAAAIIAMIASPVSSTPNKRVAPSERNIVTYTGEVNAGSAERFNNLISENVDKVIGLQVLVDPSSSTDFDNHGYLANVLDGQMVISKTDPVQGGGTEVVTNAPVQWMMGGLSIDGFFVVKPGGLNQGIASFGLQPVDEAAVRLNPAVKIVNKPF